MLRPLTFAIFIVVCLSACADPPPPIGRDLPSNFVDAQPVFNQRVKDRFPVGSDEQALIGELRREGFALNAESIAPPSPFKSVAEYTAHQIGCRLDWTILWSAKNGNITSITGRYGAACL